jgi:Hypothetical protein (DUF2513)
LVRNWTIIREILLKLEAASTANTTLNADNLAPFPEQEVAYNMRLLKEAGYISAQVLEDYSGDGLIADAFAERLTNSGHDLLDTIRNDTVWQKVQDTFKSKGLDMTFDFVLALGKKTITGLLGL